MTTATLYTVTLAQSGGPPDILLDEGACRHHDSGLFFAEGKGAVYAEAARTICAGCPVKRDCLEYALPIAGLQGIWGGTDPQQRGIERRKRGYIDGFHAVRAKPDPAPRRRKATEVPAVPMREGCPSEARYRQHRRAGEDCEACRRYNSAVIMERRRRRGGR